MDAISSARDFILEHPWVAVAVVIVAIILLRGLTMRARMRVRRSQSYHGAPKDASAVRDARPIVLKARRQMILVLIAFVVVVILIIMQNLH